MDTNKRLKTLALVLAFALIGSVALNIYLIGDEEVAAPAPTITVTAAPVEETAPASALELPYDRAWFESQGVNAADVTDDNGLTCAKTLRYELIKEQSTEFVFKDDCSGIDHAHVQDFFSKEWFDVTGNAPEWETEHLVPFSMLFDKFGRYIQFEGDKELGFELYYDTTNLVATTKSINAAKSDKVGSSVADVVCDDSLVFGCEIWDSPYASNKDYIEKSLEMWAEWEARV